MSRLRVKLNKKPCINHETLNWSSYHTETIYRFSRDLDRDRHTRRWPQTGLHLGKNTSNCDTNEPFSSLVRYQLEITFVKAVEHLRIFAIFFGVAGVRAERERKGGGERRRRRETSGYVYRKNGDDGDEQFYDGVSWPAVEVLRVVFRGTFVKRNVSWHLQARLYYKLPAKSWSFEVHNYV